MLYEDAPQRRRDVQASRSASAGRSRTRFGHVAAPAPSSSVRPVHRVRFLYVLVMIIFGVFGVRLFYLQVIQHEHYRQAAMSDQLKEYEIAATRGVIKALDGDSTVPIVLNEKLYTIFADPTLVKKPGRVAETLAAELGGDAGSYEKMLKTPQTRYVILAKKVSEKNKKNILKKKYAGIGAQEQFYRVYPNGTLAAQLLGFVNNDGQGVYGIEQALNDKLDGRPGQLKAITDVHGVPLAANKQNTLMAPVPGDDVVLTIDVSMQKQLETILQRHLERTKSEFGSALIMDPNTGAIKAMANLPTFDPGKYNEVEDPSLFVNAAAAESLEVGSVMKALTAAAALDSGSVKVDSSYYDAAVWEIDTYKITNVAEGGGPGHRAVPDILNLSLNTGATWLLMQMSQTGGTEITKQGREKWHDYMADRYLLGKNTGIEQGYEDPGYVPPPNEGYALNLTYANTSFGQAMRATPLQMAAAYSSILNGGTYYQPRLVEQTISADGAVHNKKPVVRKKNVVSEQVSNEMRRLLEGVIAFKTYIRPGFDLGQYSVGGKTGTAQIPLPGGGYSENEFNGTFVGFVGGDRAEYVISVRVDKPKIGGYAGTTAAQPVFVDLAHMLINEFGVTPKGQG